MADFIEEFLNQLEADKSKPRTDFNRLNKLIMSAQDYQGTMMFAPFMSKSSRFYKKITGVREIKTCVSLFHEGNDEVWCKILPEGDYGNLSDEDKDLYNEVAGLFDELYETLDEAGEGNWGFIRYRSYSIFQGIVLKHTNSSNVEITDNAGIAAMLIYPSKSPVDEMSKAISTRIANIGNKTWVSAVFSPDDKNRKGAMSIRFTKKEGNAVGYDCQVAFEFNSDWSKIIPDDFSVDEETMKLFGDYVAPFIGWENDNENNSLFNRKLFEEMKKILTIELAKHETAPKSEPAPENKNGQDPMLNNPTAAPAEEKKADDPLKDFPY